MPDITHIEWAGFAGVGRLGEWLGRRRVREEGGGVIVVVARGSRGLTVGLRFDVVKNFKRKNPAYGYARLVIHQWENGVDNAILTHIALRRTL